MEGIGELQRRSSSLYYFTRSEWQDTASDAIGIDPLTNDVAFVSDVAVPSGSVTVGESVTAPTVVATGSVRSSRIEAIAPGSNVVVAAPLLTASNLSVQNAIATATLVASDAIASKTVNCVSIAATGNAIVGGSLQSGSLVCSGNVASTGEVSCATLACNGFKYRGSNVIDPSDAKLDYRAWVKNGPLFQQDNTLAAAGVALGALGLTTAAGTALFQGNGTVGQGLFDNLKDLLGDSTVPGEDPADNDGERRLRLPWQRLTDIPMLTSSKTVDPRVGFAGDVYIYRGKRVASIDPVADTSLWGVGNRQVGTAIAGATPNARTLIDVDAAGYAKAYLTQIELGPPTFMRIVPTGIQVVSTGGSWADLLNLSKVPGGLISVAGVACARSEMRADGSFWVNGAQIIDASGMIDEARIRKASIQPVQMTDLLSDLAVANASTLPELDAGVTDLFSTEALEYSIFGFNVR